MAIGQSAGPRIIAVGELVSVRELPPAKKTGELWGNEATLRADDGARIFVKLRIPRQDEDTATLASRVGDFVAVWATASAGQRGEELWFDGFVTTDDLDRINSGIAVPAKA